MSRGPIVVIGAGLGGLAAACHLAGGGHDVLVVERGDGPGGRAGRFDAAGYRFDTGPTVLTMPALLEDTFAAAGVAMEDMIRLRRLDPAYRATFADGSEIRVRAGREAMTEEIRQTCGAGEARAFEHFSDWLRQLYLVEMDGFIDRNYDSPLDLVRPLRPAVELVRLGGLGRLSRRVSASFADPRLQRLFSFQSLYAGLAPQHALALFAVITYMDTVAGVYFPDGGLSEVPRALALAAEKAGATIRYGTAVERILLANGADGPVRGVRLRSGETIRTGRVVCNVDLPGGYASLLPGLAPPRRLRTGHYSPSALVWHAGVRGTLPPATTHHNIHFGTAWSDGFRALESGRLMDDPSTLVTVATASDPSAAPAGGHTIYALEPVPHLGGTLDWGRVGPATRDRLVARLHHLGYPTDAIVERAVDPRHWAADGLAHGTPFSLAHRFTQSGPFRPRNVERRAPGLVLAGCATVPGVGVPMVLLSGKLAAARVEAQS